MKKLYPQIGEFTIKYKSLATPDELYIVESDGDAAEVVRACFDADQIDWVESMIIIALSQSNKVIGFYKVSQGGVTSTVFDPRVIFQFALLCNATGILVAHNHPSGREMPSSQDKIMTQQLVEAGKVLSIRVVDHLIVTSNSYYSFANNGLI